MKYRPGRSVELIAGYEAIHMIRKASRAGVRRRNGAFSCAASYEAIHMIRELLCCVVLTQLVKMWLIRRSWH